MSVENSKQTLCKLCVNIINDTDFEEIDEVLKELLQVVLPSLDLETKDKHVTCRTCHTNLIAAYNFKSMCLDTDDVICSYMNSQQKPVAELKDVYLKEKGNVQLTDMSENQKNCRLCLQLATNKFVSLNDANVDIINNYIPQININATKETVICGLCFESLCTHGNFVKNCLEAQEQYSQNCIKSEEIDIKAEESSQDSNSASYDLFEGTTKNNKRKRVSEDAFEIKVETFLDAHSASESKAYECHNRNYHHLIHKEASQTEIYKCGVCSYETHIKDYLKRHQFRHKEVSEVQMYTSDHLLKHENASETQMYSCDIRNYESKDNSYLKTHQDPLEMQMHQCDICSYKSNSKTHLKRHQLRHKDPSQIQMYKCTMCSYKTKYKGGLKSHQLRHIDPSEVQIHQCHTCGFKSKHKSCLKVHELLHKDPAQIQMYKCMTCSYEAKNKSTLKSHQLKHRDPSDVKMYQCDTCSYKCKNKSYLKVHQLKHKDSSEIQMYKCVTCSYKTKYKFALKRHQLKHIDPSDVKMYQCEMFKCNVCSFESKYKTSLTKHYRVVHIKV